MTVLLSLMLTMSAPQPAQAGPPAPPRPAAAKPAQTKPAQTKPALPGKPVPAPPVPPLAPSPLEICDYITPDEAKALLGVDVTPTMAPSRGGLTSCGYTTPNGDALTLSIADYGIPLVAQQFFDQTRKALKTTTTNDESLGVPAFSYTIFAGPVPTPPAPVAPAGAKPTPAPAAPPPVPVNTPPGISLVALKDQRIVTLGAVGLTAGAFDNLPKLRAIVTRVLATLPAATQTTPP